MKRMMVGLSLFISLTVFPQSEKYSFKNLVGIWRNTSGIGLDVVDSNTVYIVSGNQRTPAAASFSNTGRNPASFNLSVKDSSRTIVLKGLLLFVGDNLLQWQIFDMESKPVSYDNNKRDMLFLKRIDEMYN